MSNNLMYFHPARTQPFIITFFQAVLAFKRICKVMKKRTGFMKSSGNNRRRSNFRREMKRSQLSIIEASRGKPVLKYETFRKDEEQPGAQTLAARFGDTLVSQMQEKLSPHAKQKAMFQRVSRQVANFNIGQRNGRAPMSVADKLNSSLVVDKNPNPMLYHRREGQRKHSKPTNRSRSQSLAVAAMKNSEMVQQGVTDATKQHAAGAASQEFLTGLANQLLVTGAPVENEFDEEEDIEYVPGTAIYYGAAIALQVK